METLFIKAKRKLDLNEKNLKKVLKSKQLPKNIAIAYSVQYKDIAFKIKKILSKNDKHKITKITQVLGCSKPSLLKRTQAILLLSDGKFHAVSLALEIKLPVYLFDNNKLIKISRKDVEILEKRKKASYLKFLNADNIGILISTKPGQQNLKKALEFKKKLKNKNKKYYLFVGNNINSQEFENFNIESWINTACPRLDMDDSSIINISELLKYVNY